MTEPAAFREADCASEDDVLAFAAGRLSLEQRRELHAHIDGCQHCQQLLNEAVHALATARTSGFGRYHDDDDDDDELTWSATFRPGTVVGQRYMIRQFIARGGMGEVYEAFDQELHERVALKTVTSTACDNRGAVRRLKAEVQLARRVSHPNVCRIYDFGTHAPQGALAAISFLTMEFVDGETLGQRIRAGGALPVAEARQLGRELLTGLRAAHRAGVLHRDFKSDNVMLRRSEHGFSPLILDFGLARALDQHGPASSASHRGLVGTLAYIAPEQFEGKPHTTAGDVYSFGVVWYEMLTGELPFKASSSPAVTTLDRLTRAAAPPSRANPRVPPDLDELVLRCLQRTEQERFKTAAEVLARLDELESRAPLPRRPRRAALGAAAGLLIAASAFAVLGAHQLQIATDQKRPATAASGVRTSPLPAAIAAQAAAAALVVPHPSPAATPTPPALTSQAMSPPPPPPPPKSHGLGRKPTNLEAPAPSSAKPTAPPPQAEPKPTGGWENPFGRGG